MTEIMWDEDMWEEDQDKDPGLIFPYEDDEIYFGCFENMDNFLAPREVIKFQKNFHWLSETTKEEKEAWLNNYLRNREEKGVQWETGKFFEGLKSVLFFWDLKWKYHFDTNTFTFEWIV